MPRETADETIKRLEEEILELEEKVRGLEEELETAENKNSELKALADRQFDDIVSEVESSRRTVDQA